jgi:alpha-N-acetylglucosaminidase
MLVMLAAVAAATDPAVVQPVATDPAGVTAVRALVSRALGAPAVAGFDLSIEPSLCTKAPHGCFVLRNGAERTVAVSGSNANELAAGVGHYLRTVGKASLSWAGTGGRRIPDTLTKLPLPRLPGAAPVQVSRADRWSYYQNVCTPSFSFVWYSWDDWQAELDLLALSGVNLFLAYTGQEAIYQKVFKELGVADADIRGEYFSGPAFLAWNRGQDLRGLGSPLPQSWVDTQWRLQRQILQRARSLGMTPALPAFQGWVPNAVATLFPNATITRVGEREGWCPAGSLSDKYECPAIVDALDPLFQRIAASFLAHVQADFGPAVTGQQDAVAVYAADGFFSDVHTPWLGTASGMVPRGGASRGRSIGQPPEWWRAHSAAVYKSIQAADPNALWMYQTYLLHATSLALPHQPQK